jgi:hypothetical protein
VNVQQSGTGLGLGFLDDANSRFLWCCQDGFIHVRENDVFNSIIAITLIPCFALDYAFHSYFHEN